MTWDRSWSWGDGSSWLAGVYEWLRVRVNVWLADWLGEHAGLHERSLILEGGAGPAGASSLLARRCPAGLSLALDLDREALRQARRGDARLPVVQGDLCAMPFGTGRFDLVWNSSTLEHLPDPGPPLGEMVRVARPGGSVFVGVPYRYGPLGFQPLIRGTAFGHWVGPVFSRRELLDLMLPHALEPVAVCTYACRCFIGVLARKPGRDDQKTDRA